MDVLVKKTKINVPITTFNSCATEPRYVEVELGDMVCTFIGRAKLLFNCFKKNNTPDTILLIKNGLVLPPRCTFFDLLKCEARSPVVPDELLFEFENKQQPLSTYKLLCEDSKSKFSKEDSSKVTYSPKTLGILVDRLWYERNKTVFPYSNWQLLSPEKHLKVLPKPSVRESFYF